VQFGKLRAYSESIETLRMPFGKHRTPFVSDRHDGDRYWKTSDVFSEGIRKCLIISDLNRSVPFFLGVCRSS